MKKRLILSLLIAMLIVPLVQTNVYAAVDKAADLPYESYSYNSESLPVNIPAPYYPERIISGDDLSVGSFKELGNIYFNGDNTVYLCDEGNNRIIVTDVNFNLKNIITEFENNGNKDGFNVPSGVFDDGEFLYIADKQNSRIVVLDNKNYSLDRVLETPSIPQLGGEFTYNPVELTVDNAGRIYVIASGINQGLICLNENGEFSTFIGAPTVVPDIMDIIWRKFATKKQIEQMQQYVPTEYSSLCIDSNGFIYCVSQTSETIPVAKLNSGGENILIENKSIKKRAKNGKVSKTGYGDSAYDPELMTYFTDIIAEEDGSYYVLDSKQNKIYYYSHDGYLMYAFTATGAQKGVFLSADSIEKIGDKLVVSDRMKGTLTVFSLTDFGANVHNAVQLYNNGEYDKSAEVWNVVKKQASGYTLAVIGIAKTDVLNGNYSDAMSQVKNIHEHQLYSRIFTKWRDDLIKDKFYLFIVLLAVILVAVMVLCRLLKKSAKYQAFITCDTLRDLKYSWYVMFHPFDGFWDIKREKKGNMKTALIILVSFSVLYAVRAQFSGYVVTKTLSSEVNALYNLMMILLPILFWIISNWCFTSLMDGKGTMKDIFIATCYSLAPYTVLSIPLFIMSHVLTADEAVFYTVINTAAVIWSIALIFFGMMTTHEYSLSKAVLTAILTLIGICLIIFILLLIVNIAQEIFTFGYNIYRELVFRTY